MSIDFDVNWTGSKNSWKLFRVLLQRPLSCRRCANEQNIGAGDRSELFHMIADALFQDFLPGPFSTQKRSRLADILAYMSSVQDDEIPVCGTTLRRVIPVDMPPSECQKSNPAGVIREACACPIAAEVVEH